MKKSALSLLLAASVSLPVAAFANNDSDALSASFERGFDKGPSGIVATSASRDFDTLQYLVNVALAPRDDAPQLLASFDRGFDKGPSEIVATPASRDFDTLQYLVNVALAPRNDAPQLLASFDRGFDKGPSTLVGNVKGESGDPMWKVFAQANWGSEYVSLMLAAKESGKPIKSAAAQADVYPAHGIAVN